MPQDVGILTAILQNFISVITLGYGKVLDDVYYLLYIFVTIEVTLCAIWWALDKKEILVEGLSKILTIGFITFLIANWPTVVKEVLDSMMLYGAKAASSSLDYKMMSDPSRVAGYGMTAIEPIIDYVKSMSVLDFMGPLPMTLLLVAATIFILLGFFIIAWVLFMAQMEFWLMAVLGLIFIPLYVFEKTRFLADGAIKSIIGKAAHLMVLTFIISVAIPMLQTFTLPHDPNYQACFGLLLGVVAVALLCMSSGQLANSLVSGLPSGGNSGMGIVVGAVMSMGMSALTRGAAGPGAEKGSKKETNLKDGADTGKGDSK